eukprot:747412-Hanusia_phi.AAC.1
MPGGRVDADEQVLDRGDHASEDHAPSPLALPPLRPLSTSLAVTVTVIRLMTLQQKRVQIRDGQSEHVRTVMLSLRINDESPADLSDAEMVFMQLYRPLDSPHAMPYLSEW